MATPPTSTRTPQQDEALLQQYAPIVYFHPSEQHWPATVDWYLARTQLVNGQGTPVLNPVGAIANLAHAGGTADYRLEILDSSARVGQVGALNNVTIYGYVFPRQGQSGTIAKLDLFYWFFYPFNGNTVDIQKIKSILGAMVAAAAAGVVFMPWNPLAAIALAEASRLLAYIDGVNGLGMHEGDWEHITVRVDLPGQEITSVYYAAHDGGQWALPPGSEDPYTPLRFQTSPDGRPIGLPGESEK